MLKNTLIVALIATLPALAQEEAPQFPTAPAQQAPHWGARGQMPNRPQGDMHKRMLDKFDADKDGQLNEAEQKSMKDEMQKMRGQRGQRPEGFQPGKRGERPEGFQPGMRGERHEGFEGAKAGNRRRPHSERPEMINKFDADKDGQLSKEELEALKGSRGKNRAQGRPGRPGRPGMRQHGERPAVLPMLPPAGAPEAPEAPVAPAPQQ